MMLTRVTPLGEMLQFDPLRHWLEWPQDGGPGSIGAEGLGPYLRFDVLEKNGAYELKADLPGVKRDDIQIHVSGKDIEIVAEVKEDRKQEEEDGKLLRRERLHGRFHRRLTLAEELDAEQARAAYRDGVLTITLPKSKDARRRQLKVH